MTEEERELELLRLWLILQDNFERVFYIEESKCLCSCINYLTYSEPFFTKAENKLMFEEMNKEAEVRSLNKFSFFWPLGELQPRVEFVQQQIIKILKS